MAHERGPSGHEITFQGRLKLLASILVPSRTGPSPALINLFFSGLFLGGPIVLVIWVIDEHPEGIWTESFQVLKKR